MHELAKQIEEAVDAIRQQWSGKPRVGIILGTGLGSVAEEIEADVSLDYETIPHFPRSTAIGHTGQLVCGKLAGVPVVAMEGRFHAYEGYSYRQITFPVRVMKALGARPILDLDMRLGEGTGAALAMSIIEAAVKLYNEMATFSAAGVSHGG